MMGATTGIEWTDRTWNPVRGCSRVSEGCRNCYAESMARRFSRPGLPYEGLIARGGQWNGEVKLVHDKLAEPLRWRKPQRVFCNSMSDLFHERVPDEFILDVFTIMAIASQHRFQILTKRPHRMLALMRRQTLLDEIYSNWYTFSGGAREVMAWPLPNVHLGVSVENQETADERIPLLLETPAAVRWVSAEPLLGPIDLTKLDGGSLGVEYRGLHIDALIGGRQSDSPWHVNWVVVGGESGPGARPCDIESIRDLVRQCKAASVPCFVKQLGADPGYTGVGGPGTHSPIRLKLRDAKGGDPAEWHEDLRVRELPECQPLAS